MLVAVGFFSRKDTVELESTGNARDDEVLRGIASRSDLKAPRDWIHYLYFPDAASASTAADSIAASGWSIRGIGRTDPDDGTWFVDAARYGIVASPRALSDARRFFDSVVAEYPGAEYDGWEATI